MTALRVVLLADEKPGHFHLSEGVVAALARLAQVELFRLDVRRYPVVPGRLLHQLVSRRLSPALILAMGYGVRAAHLPPADVVVSAGGNTLAANVAASRLLSAENIFIGSLRRYPPEDFGLVITSYARYGRLPRHLVCLKPCALDPTALGRPEVVPVFGAAHPPKRAGLLLGGNTPDFSFSPAEWQRMLTLVEDSHERWGTLWQISTSRRTPDHVSARIAELAAHSKAISRFIDYRRAGPGSLRDVFASVDIILCTEDSSTMISEAIAARLPVIGLTPKVHGFTPQEAEYRRFLAAQNWTCSLMIDALDMDHLDKALSRLCPMSENHLDLLAARLRHHLPHLLQDAAGEKPN